MSHTINIPMTDTFYDELEDSFVDNDKMTSHQFVFSILRNVCKDAKAGKLNKSCSINVMKDGKMAQDMVRLKDVNLSMYTLLSDPAWKPKELKEEADGEVKFWEHKVTDKTFEYLTLYGQMTKIRYDRHNESFDKHEAAKMAEIHKRCDESASEDEKKILSKQMEADEKTFATAKENREKLIPTCLEHAVYGAVYPQLHNEVMKNMDRELDKEFEEMYPKTTKA